MGADFSFRKTIKNNLRHQRTKQCAAYALTMVRGSTQRSEM